MENIAGVQQETPDDEPLLIVDIHDRVMGSAAKPKVHAARQWHRQSYVIILDGVGNVLLQKRSLRRQFDPGRWTTSVSGHVTGEDTYLESARREVCEEIGVESPELMYLGKVLAYSHAFNEICGGPSAVFIGLLPMDISAFKRQESEISDIAWFPIDDLASALMGDRTLYYKDQLVQFSDDFVPVFEFFLNEYCN